MRRITTLFSPDLNFCWWLSVSWLPTFFGGNWDNWVSSLICIRWKEKKMASLLEYMCFAIPNGTYGLLCEMGVLGNKILYKVSFNCSLFYCSSFNCLIIYFYTPLFCKSWLKLYPWLNWWNRWNRWNFKNMKKKNDQKYILCQSMRSYRRHWVPSLEAGETYIGQIQPPRHICTWRQGGTTCWCASDLFFFFKNCLGCGKGQDKDLGGRHLRQRQKNYCILKKRHIFLTVFTLKY